MNSEFGKLSEDGTFATAILATYFSPKDHLVVVNAGQVTVQDFGDAPLRRTYLGLITRQVVDASDRDRREARPRWLEP